MYTYTLYTCIFSLFIYRKPICINYVLTKAEHWYRHVDIEVEKTDPDIFMCLWDLLPIVATISTCKYIHVNRYIYIYIEWKTQVLRVSCNSTLRHQTANHQLSYNWHELHIKWFCHSQIWLSSECCQTFDDRLGWPLKSSDLSHENLVATVSGYMETTLRL